MFPDIFILRMRTVSATSILANGWWSQFHILNSSQFRLSGKTIVFWNCFRTHTAKKQDSWIKYPKRKYTRTTIFMYMNRTSTTYQSALLQISKTESNHRSQWITYYISAYLILNFRGLCCLTYAATSAMFLPYLILCTTRSYGCSLFRYMASDWQYPEKARGIKYLGQCFYSEIAFLY